MKSSEDLISLRSSCALRVPWDLGRRSKSVVGDSPIQNPTANRVPYFVYYIISISLQILQVIYFRYTHIAPKAFEERGKLVHTGRW